MDPKKNAKMCLKLNTFWSFLKLKKTPKRSKGSTKHIRIPKFY